MSNFKKFLALVLATLMVASMMVISAPAASAYAPTGDYATDITLLSSLGVMLGDGESYKEKENVTRWQMALLIARIVTGEIGNEMWEAEKSEYFTDVKADHYPGAIDFCAEMGYIKGVGDNLFDPDANIIYQDALTMIVRLLGYETETTSYPWGYILQARTLALTNDINTGNKTNLLREEVANLLATALYIPLATAGKVIDTSSEDGTQTTSLIVSGLKAASLGVATLVATPTAAFGDTKTGDALFAKIKLADGNVKTVAVANITKKDSIHINDYLGFTGDVVAINAQTSNPVYLIAMHDVTYTDAHSYSTSTYGSEKVTINGNNYWAQVDSVLEYGSDVNNVFVKTDICWDVNDADNRNYSKFDFAGKGRIIVCNVGNDSDITNDILRLIPFDTVKAFYDIELTSKISAKDLDTATPVKNYTNDVRHTYFVAEYGYLANPVPATATTEADLKPTNWIKSIGYGTGDNNDVARLRGLYMDGGLAHEDGAGSSLAYLRKRTTLTSFSKAPYLYATDVYVAVLGDIVNGDVQRGCYKQIGDVAFVTVANSVEIAYGTATIKGVKDAKIVLGDTEYSVGWTKIKTGYDAAGKVNGWYKNFYATEVDAAIKANIYKEVTYETVDGLITAIWGEDAIVDNPNNKAPLILVIQPDGSNVTVNADGTINAVAFNLETLKEEAVKLGQINGKNPGTLINSFGLGVAAPILVENFVVTEDTTVADVVKALVGANNTYVIPGTTATSVSYYMIAVTNKTDDVYDVSTAANSKLDRVILGAAANATPAVNGTPDEIALNFRVYTTSALATNFAVGSFYDYIGDAAAYTFAGGSLAVSKSTQYVIFGSNGCVVKTGVLPTTPANSTTSNTPLLISEASGAAVLELDDDKIVIFNAGKTVEEIAPFVGSPSASATTTNGGWYTLSWKSNYDSMTVTTVGETTYYNYLFKGLYNLTTRDYEDVIITSLDYKSQPESIFTNWYRSSGVYGDLAAKKGASSTSYGYQSLYKVWFVDDKPITTDHRINVSASSMYSWALANDYSVGIIRTTYDGDGNLTYTGLEYGVEKKLDIDAVTLTPTVGEKYTVTNTNSDEENARNSDIVVSHTIFIMNQSSGSGADELKSIPHNLFENDDYQGKVIKNGNDGNKNELVLYKIDENGVAEVIVNFCDMINATTTTITDKAAK